ncbi:hypothetical protein [[Actinomadura] parvosata]|uniref:hypothetical protein n=1 Tax=[Actinomadura] parvosata TaxID=1955412 RepID=UPI0012BCBCBF|nr:hypothetical protein [Nonomuraea sp. ATCC 55076]
MSIERKRWAQRAQELRFEQLTIARKQAEGWRAGLAALIALLSAVLIVKGRDTVLGLEDWVKVSVALLLAAALAALVSATVLALRAASGTPGSEILLTGEGLREWTQREVRAIGRRIHGAAALTIVALTMLVTALGFTWFGASAENSTLQIEVVGRTERLCGELVGSADGELIVKGKSLQRMPLSGATSINPVKHCG